MCFVLKILLMIIISLLDLRMGDKTKNIFLFYRCTEMVKHKNQTCTYMRFYLQLVLLNKEKSDNYLFKKDKL